jgi:hypothetical protein
VAGFGTAGGQPEATPGASTPPGRGVTMAVVPDDDDAVLEAQLAHLDAIEQRHEQLYRQELARADADTLGAPPLPEEAWPQSIGEPPMPDGASLAAYVAWLDRARALLAARAARNRDELALLESQWVHVYRNVGRFQPEDVAGVIESLGQVRERIAADETCVHLLRLLRAWLRTWEELAAGAAREVVGVAEAAAPAPPADVELVRRLLDEVALDRARDAAALLDGVLESLSGVALDMEVVQRQGERSPDEIPALVRGLQERLNGVVEDLRATPGTEVALPQVGEPLHATLRRCVDRYQARLAAELAWSGGEPPGAEVRAAVLWVVQEFLAACLAAGATRATVALANTPNQAVLRLSADAVVAAPPGAAEPGWVLRCRARGAVAGGALVGLAADWSSVEVRFPVEDYG